MRAALCALLLATTLTACGGDGDGSSPSPPSPGQDPCAAARQEAFEVEAPAARTAPVTKSRGLDPSPRWRVLESLWIHQQAGERRRSITTLGPVAATSSDVGDIAVLRDEGDLIVPANAFDLKGAGPSFHAQRAGRLRRPPDRRLVQNRHRQPRQSRGRRQPARGCLFCFPVLLDERANRLRQLRRQHHVS